MTNDWWKQTIKTGNQPALLVKVKTSQAYLDWFEINVPPDLVHG